MNIYLLITFGYLLPTLICIGATMLIDDRLTVTDVLVSAVPLFNIFVAFCGIGVVVDESGFTRKVIWRKK